MGVKTEPRDDEPAVGVDEPHAREDESGESGPTSHRPSVLEQLWLIVAVVLLIAAAILLLRSHTDAAFGTAALGVCAWFLNFRDRLKREHRLQKRGRRNWEAR